jgi:serine/threonine protein kinase
MEYFKHGDLQQYMDKPLPETQTRIIIVQLLEGLKVMHGNGFTHRDLKPKDIFVVEKEPYFWVKIGDFGITKRTSNDQTLTWTT